MTTLNEFKTMLRVIDQDNMYFDCNTRELMRGVFAFDFDGYMTCIIDMRNENRIYEYIDTNDTLWVRERCTCEYASIIDWVNASYHAAFAVLA